MGTKILSPNVLKQNLSKDLRQSWEVHFKGNLDTLNPKKNLWQCLKPYWRPSSYVVDVCTGVPKKLNFYVVKTL